MPTPPTLTKAGIADCGTIAALAEAIWKVHYPAIITMEQIDYMLELMYSETALRRQMEEGQQFYLLHTDQSTVGYISFTDHGVGDFFLHKFYLRNDLRGKGLGTFFLQETLRIMGQPVSVRLTVNRQNYTSINFYFKNRFIIEKVADFDIGNGYQMNDFVMVLHTEKKSPPPVSSTGPTDIA